MACRHPIFAFACLALALLAGPIPAARADQTAASLIADSVRPTLPKTFEGNVVLVAAEAEGSLLVLTVDLPADATLTGQEIAEVFAGGFCERQGAGTAFDRGLRIRVDARIGRRPRQEGVVIDRCPTTS